MVKTIDMQDIRYLNLFERIMKVRAHFCFRYNENIFFCVPRPLVSKAIGEGGRNIKKMNEVLGKRIKVIAAPQGEQDARVFIGDILSPLSFKDLEITENEIVLTSGGKNKAALIGRNKRRLQEMEKIVRGFFGKEFRIV
jgi:NusA-like KH domain protein